MKKKTKMGAEAPKKKSKAKWLLIGLGAAALTGVLSYFGLEMFDKNNVTAIDESKPETKQQKKEKTSGTKISAPKKTSTKKKSTKKASTAKQSEKQQHKQQAEVKNESPIDAKAIASELFTALNKKDFLKTITVLNKIKNVTDYAKVNEVFSKMFLRTVRQTIVNGALGSFSLENQKRAIRLLFLKMGLKYNGQKWTLSGIDDRRLITTQQTKVWKDPRHAVVVPINMLLGKEIARRGDFTVFENDKKYFLVQNDHVKYYKN